MAIQNFPVFRAAIQNKEFYALFLEAIKKAGSENYNIQGYRKKWIPMIKPGGRLCRTSISASENLQESGKNVWKLHYISSRKGMT